VIVITEFVLRLRNKGRGSGGWPFRDYNGAHAMDIGELSDLELDDVSGGKVCTESSTTISMGMFGSIQISTSACNSGSFIEGSGASYTPPKRST
jgi:hypothetical protein